MKILKDKNTGTLVLLSPISQEIIDEIDKYFFEDLGIKIEEAEIIKDVESSISITNKVVENLEETLELIKYGKNILSEFDKQKILELLNYIYQMLGKEIKGVEPRKNWKKQLMKWLKNLKEKFLRLVSSVKVNV